MDCWGQCKYCGKYGHKSDFCRNKPAEQAGGGVSTTTATEIANTAQVKNGKKKNKNKLGKAAAEKPEETQQKTADKKEEVPALTESEESDE